MDKETPGEKDHHETETELSYDGYVRCGGLINKEEYESALSRARGGKVGDNARAQAEGIARFSGVNLDRLPSHIDPRVLYGILRNDTAPAEIVHHHSQMSDQQLFVEMLRMLEADNAVTVVQNTYPNIFH